MVNIRKTTGTDGKGIVYYLPQSLINNTLAAFNTGGMTPAQLDPNAAVHRTALPPASSAGAATSTRTGTASSTPAS